MATWNDLRLELERSVRSGNPNAHDHVRRKYYSELAALTGRPLIVYAVDFLQQSDKVRGAGAGLQIELSDKESFAEVMDGMPDGPVDLLLHSPGGSPTAAESIVVLLRSKFSHVRVLIPNIAKSAATMLALSGNSLVIGERGELGPIDPQFILSRDNQQVVSPAQAILDQFKDAQVDITGHPERLGSWVPILRQYGPSLLAEANNAIELSKQLVRDWLTAYMFSGRPDAAQRAKEIAEFFGDHNNFRSHGRFVGVDTLLERGLEVVDLRADRPLADAIWRAYTAISITFDGTGAFKLIENNLGGAYVRLIQQVQINLASLQLPAGGTPATPPSGQGPTRDRDPRSPTRPNRPPRGQR